MADGRPQAAIGIASVRNLNGRNSASCGDYSLSVDLTSDRISAQGRLSEVRPFMGRLLLFG